MGLLDRLKRALGIEDEDITEFYITYECTVCGATFEAKHQPCPECGGDAVIEREDPPW